MVVFELKVLVLASCFSIDFIKHLRKMKVSNIFGLLLFGVMISSSLSRARGDDTNGSPDQQQIDEKNEATAISITGRNLTAAATINLKRSFSIDSPIGTIQLCACKEEECINGIDCADTNSIFFMTRSDMVPGDFVILTNHTDIGSFSSNSDHNNEEGFVTFQHEVTNGLHGYVVTTDFPGSVFNGGGSHDIASKSSYFKDQPGTLNNIDLQGSTLDSLSLMVNNVEIQTVGYPGQYEQRWTIDVTIVFWARICDKATDPNNCIPVTNSNAPSSSPTLIPIPSSFKLNETGLQAAATIPLGQYSGAIDDKFDQCIVRVCSAKTRNGCTISENAIEFLITPEMTAGTTETVNEDVDSSFSTFVDHITDGIDDWIVTSHFPGLLNNGGGASQSYQESQYFFNQTGPQNLVDLQGCEIVAISILMNKDVHFFSRGSTNRDDWMSYMFEATLIFWTYKDSECFDSYIAPSSDAPSTIPTTDGTPSTPPPTPTTTMAPNLQNSSSGLSQERRASNLYIYIIAGIGLVFIFLEIWCCVRLKPIAMIRHYRKNGAMLHTGSQSTENDDYQDTDGADRGSNDESEGRQGVDSSSLDLVASSDRSSLDLEELSGQYSVS